MKSPFASLNWGVHSPTSPYIFTVATNGAGSSHDVHESVYLWSHPMQVYTDFASAFEHLFQRAAGQMDNRAEWFFDNFDTTGMTIEEVSDELGVPTNETLTVFDLQGFYNEAPRQAKMTVFSSGHQSGESPLDNYVTFRTVCTHVWARLSEITQFESWEDYQNILRRRVSKSERERLNQSFAAFIELIPARNLWKVIQFSGEFDDDFYSSAVRVTLEILPRNMEGLV